MRVVHAINVFEKFINVSKAVLLARFLINPRSNFSPVTFFVLFSFFFYPSQDKKKSIRYIFTRSLNLPSLKRQKEGKVWM